MDKIKILSGEEIVAKGLNKVETTLPEIGLKDVIPNGSWLEQKQIQSALEARKQLVEVPRIEKGGMLSHATWRPDLKLAEVTRQSGGFWQFMGHHKDRRLYITPEEAIFLIEVNSLLLKYDGVTVSLQQAYSLLLSDEITIIQYKVYASLSRLGYKIFRHNPKLAQSKSNETAPKTTSEENKLEVTEKTALDGVTLSDVSDPMTISSNNETITSEDTSMKDTDVSHEEDSKCNTSNEGCDEVDMGIKKLNESEINKDNETISEAVNTSSEEAMAVDESNANVGIDEVDRAIATDKNDNLSELTSMIVEENNFKEDNKLLEDVEESSTQISENDNIADELQESEQQVSASASDNAMELGNDNLEDCSKLLPTNEEKRDHSTSKPQECSPGPSNANVDPLTKYCKWKLDKLKGRRAIAHPTLDIHESFKDCPDALDNQIITVNTPKEEYLPKNIFINNLRYVINIENVRTKNVTRPASSDSTYTLSDEVNGAHIRRVTNANTQILTLSRRPQIQQSSSFPPFFPSFRPNIPFRHYNYWRPRPNMSYFQFNLFFQRPYMSNFNSRFQFFPRMHMPIYPRHNSSQIGFTANNEFQNSSNRSRKRPKDQAKITHLDNLKSLAQRLKSLVSSGHDRAQNIEAIQSLINTYNTRFRTRLRLSEEYEIVSDETIVDTITLDDEDEASKVKRPRLDSKPDLFLENLNKIRESASKLKKLESENRSSARHRRALSGVIKTFNKYFNAEIEMTNNYDVFDRRHINLDSSSDSDCVIEEVPKAKSGKKLRNPFNILKKLSEKLVTSLNTTSRLEIPESPSLPNTPDSHESLEEIFKESWLPGHEDFGRPEVISRDTMTARFVETKKEEYLFDFLKDQTHKFNNWVEIKIAFLKSIEETNALIHSNAMIENNVEIKSLIKPEDCTDMATVLKKLSIINGSKTVKNESILNIHYDVYNRNVKNFRKADRPKPHLRVVCIDASSTCITGIDIATLHANVKDDVTILFAVVGVGSISFLQMNPTDLPVYQQSNDLG